MKSITTFSGELKKRKQRLADWLKKNELDLAVFLKEELEIHNANYLYFGGGYLSGEYGAILVESNGDCTAIAHEYSFQRAESSGMYSKVYEIRQSMLELVSMLKRIVGSKFPKGKVSVDFGMSANSHDLLRESGIIANENSLREFVFQERSIKSDFEIEQMESAIEMGKRAFDKTIGVLKQGLSIDAIQKILNREMINEGAVSNSFETDIRLRRNLGEDEADRLRRGDLLLFDFGAKIHSMYLSDIGRTVPFGKSKGKEIDFLTAVCSIKREGLKRISASKSGSEVRKEIDEIIQEHGYVSTHRAGHQIGLNVHEPYGPHLNYGSENEKSLRARNVVTWEPGIGLRDNKQPKNRFGMAHMEDMVLVQPSGKSKVLGNLDLEYW